MGSVRFFQPLTYTKEASAAMAVASNEFIASTPWPPACRHWWQSTVRLTRFLKNGSGKACVVSTVRSAPAHARRRLCSLRHMGLHGVLVERLTRDTWRGEVRGLVYVCWHSLATCCSDVFLSVLMLMEPVLWRRGLAGSACHATTKMTMRFCVSNRVVSRSCMRAVSYTHLTLPTNREV